MYSFLIVFKIDLTTDKNIIYIALVFQFKSLNIIYFLIHYFRADLKRGQDSGVLEFHLK